MSGTGVPPALKARVAEIHASIEGHSDTTHVQALGEQTFTDDVFITRCEGEWHASCNLSHKLNLADAKRMCARLNIDQKYLHLDVAVAQYGAAGKETKSVGMSRDEFYAFYSDIQTLPDLSERFRRACGYVEGSGEPIPLCMSTLQLQQFLKEEQGQKVSEQYCEQLIKYYGIKHEKGSSRNLVLDPALLVIRSRRIARNVIFAARPSPSAGSVCLPLVAEVTMKSGGPDVLQSGWLQKVDRKGKVAKRWVELHSGHLAYYGGASNTLPKASCTLDTGSKASVEQKAGKSYLVIAGAKAEFKFTDRDEVVAEWVTAINKQVDVLVEAHDE